MSTNERIFMGAFWVAIGVEFVGAFLVTINARAGAAVAIGAAASLSVLILWDALAQRRGWK